MYYADIRSQNLIAAVNCVRTLAYDGATVIKKYVLNQPVAKIDNHSISDGANSLIAVRTQCFDE